MARIVLHTENAVGSYDSVPNSFPTEASMATALLVRGSSTRQSFVYTGMDVSDPDNGLEVSISSGTACIEGFVIQNTSTATVSSLPNATDPIYIWASLSRDGNGLVDDFDLTYTVASTWQDEFVLLGKCTTAGGQVTATTSSIKTPSNDNGTYTGNGAASQTFWLGITPRMVIVASATANGPWICAGSSHTSGLVDIITYGFTVSGAASTEANYSGASYYYFVTF